MYREGKSPRILITGASGFLGSYLVQGFEGDSSVSGTYLQHRKGVPPCHALPLDITDPSMVDRTVKEGAYDFIIHTAAITSPDQCDKDRDAAYQINVEGTGNLAKAADAQSILFIYISTDLIFDGKEGPYSETDPTSPCNYYAETKSMGEETVRSRCGRWLILRTALMYGRGNGVNHSCIDWMVGRLDQGEEVPLFQDQYRSFLYVEDVAPAIRTLLEKGVENEVLHLAGPDRMNRYDFGKRFVDLFGYSQDLLRPILMADLSGHVQRGKDCSLRSDLITALGFQPRSVTEGLKAMKQSWLIRNRSLHA